MNWLSTFKEKVSRCGFFRHVLAVALSAYGRNFDPTTTSTAANTTSFYLSSIFLLLSQLQLPHCCLHCLFDYPFDTFSFNLSLAKESSVGLPLIT